MNPKKIFMVLLCLLIKFIGLYGLVRMWWVEDIMLFTLGVMIFIFGGEIVWIYKIK